MFTQNKYIILFKKYFFLILKNFNILFSNNNFLRIRLIFFFMKFMMLLKYIYLIFSDLFTWKQFEHST